MNRFTSFHPSLVLLLRLAIHLEYHEELIETAYSYDNKNNY